MVTIDQVMKYVEETGGAATPSLRSMLVELAEGVRADCVEAAKESQAEGDYVHGGDPDEGSWWQEGDAASMKDDIIRRLEALKW